MNEIKRRFTYPNIGGVVRPLGSVALPVGDPDDVGDEDDDGPAFWCELDPLG